MRDTYEPPTLVAVCVVDGVGIPTPVIMEDSELSSVSEVLLRFRRRDESECPEDEGCAWLLELAGVDGRLADRKPCDLPRARSDW